MEDKRKGKVVDMQPVKGPVKPAQPKELDAEQLKNVIQQLQQQVNMWKQRAYESNAKNTRVDLILNCMGLQAQYIKENKYLFEPEAMTRMATELYDALYPPKEVEVDKDTEVTE